MIKLLLILCLILNYLSAILISLIIHKKVIIFLLLKRMDLHNGLKNEWTNGINIKTISLLQQKLKLFQQKYFYKIKNTYSRTIIINSVICIFLPYFCPILSSKSNFLCKRLNARFSILDTYDLDMFNLLATSLCVSGFPIPIP